MKKIIFFYLDLIDEALSSGKVDMEASIKLAEENFTLAQKAVYKFLESSLTEISQESRFYITSAIENIEVEKIELNEIKATFTDLDFVNINLTSDITALIEDEEKFQKIDVIISVIKIVEEQEIEIDESKIDIDVFFAAESNATIELEIVGKFVESFGLEIEILETVIEAIKTDISIIAEIIDETPCSGVLFTENDLGCICDSPKELFKNNFLISLMSFVSQFSCLSKFQSKIC